MGSFPATPHFARSQGIESKIESKSRTWPHVMTSVARTYFLYRETRLPTVGHMKIYKTHINLLKLRWYEDFYIQ
jgi:hypothetical protein